MRRLAGRRFALSLGVGVVIPVAVLVLLWSPLASESGGEVTIAPASVRESTTSPQDFNEATVTAPVVEELDEFEETYGDPPDATLGRFRIPKIGVDAPLGERFVGPDGDMPLPSGPSDVVWYDFSGWPGYGGVLGTGRNAVYAGHLDYAAKVQYAGVDYRGRGVFSSLNLLVPGDTIQVEIEGKTLLYRVEWKQNVSAGTGDWTEILSGEVGADSITLITCSGEFDFQSLEYTDRLVIRAVRN